MVKNRSESRLGAAVRSARKARRLTIEQLATKAGLSARTAQAVESGDGNFGSCLALIDALELELTGRSLPAGDTIGERLALPRERQGLSQRELADAAGLSHPTIIAIERGEPGRLAAVEKVASVLGAGFCLVPKGETLPFYVAAGNSSALQDWTTPADLLERLYRVIDRAEFDLDPCSPTVSRKRAPVKARVRFTADEGGLSLEWRGLVFVNPPYGRELADWIRKCREEVEAGRASSVIALIPARPDTMWWHEHVADIADVWMLRGRLAFGGSGGSTAPFPSALVVWGADPKLRARMNAEFSTAWHIPARACPRLCSLGVGVAAAAQ